MSKKLNISGFEETGRTKDVAADAPIPGTKNVKVFSRGPIGTHLMGHAIYDWLMLADGRWFDFDRIAKMDRLGVVDLEQVAIGSEIIIHPGIIYRIGIVNPAELSKWRAAQDRIEKLMQDRMKGTENASRNSRQLAR